MSEKILIVEDELTLQETIAYNLKNQGYEVATSANGLDAIAKAKEGNPDLIILDVMLPGVDGFEACRQIRKSMDLPILMLTARSDEIDRVVGLEVGADDYLTKPFSMRELLARIKALLRRINMIRATDNYQDETRKVFHFGNLSIDEFRHEVKLNDSIVDLSPKEYELLAFFAKNPRKVMSREILLEKVWGWDYIGGNRSVDVHIRWLREKLEEDPRKPKRLITIRGSGYIFEG